MKYHLVSLKSEIYEDDYEQGMGGYTGCGYSSECIALSFETEQDAIKHLASSYGLSEELSDYEWDHVAGTIATAKMVADHSNAQNGGWFEPTEEERERWVRGEQKLYTEEFTVSFVRCL